MSHEPGRNDPCPCGSGLKYKQCCQGKDKWYERFSWPAIVLALLFIGGLVVAGLSFTGEDESQQAARPPGPAPAGKVWSEEHGHWHDVR